MKLFNTLSRKVETLKPLTEGQISVYTCGPTVYDHVHIGNLRAFIVADSLRRTLKLANFQLQAVMNITDVDDKTIHRSLENHKQDEPAEALKKLTQHYEKLFLDDSAALGIDMADVKLVRATDHIETMQKLIGQIVQAGFAYPADDGVYFDLGSYTTKYPYGLLSNVAANPQAAKQRINNDEYDKTEARDFALWKKSDPGEPSWELALADTQMAGRPGWHIECSAMSTEYLGQPFDIHTGGIDLVFPHHENEIAQTKAATGKDLAKTFVHNEHLLVDGRKMSKRYNNFFTTSDITEKGFDPLAFRLLVLQAHYRSQQNFTWEALEAAQNFLTRLKAFADRRFQDDGNDGADAMIQLRADIQLALQSDLDTPRALAALGSAIDKLDAVSLARQPLDQLVVFLDQALGLKLGSSTDVSGAQQRILSERKQARLAKDFKQADILRQKLRHQGIGVEDTPRGHRWYRL